MWRHVQSLIPVKVDSCQVGIVQLHIYSINYPCQILMKDFQNYKYVQLSIQMKIFLKEYLEVALICF